MYNLGVGKTTIIQKVCKELQLKRTAIKGFFTSELRENGRRVGFDIISLDGTRSPLARVGYVVARCPENCSFYLKFYCCAIIVLSGRELVQKLAST